MPNAKEHAPSKSASVRKTRMAPRREAIVLMRALTIPVNPGDVVCRFRGEIQIKLVLPS